MKVVTKFKYKTTREDKLRTLTINERERLKTKEEREKHLARIPMQVTTLNAELQ